MGNVPAKEVGYNNGAGGSSGGGGRSRSNTYLGLQSGLGNGTPRRNTTSNAYPASGILNGGNAGSGSGGSSLDKRSKKTEEKDRLRRKHCLDLIVRFTENVDGGYLAPYGTYKSNLDYNTDIVRALILRRQLAPFYTPLQDFDETWTDQELIVILNQLPLHLIEVAYSNEEEEDDIDNHKIHKLTNFYRRQEQKAKIKVLMETMKQIQKDEETKFVDEKEKKKAGIANGIRLLEISSNSLLLRLYRHATECPICFLYYPENMNISRCCLQPICTECFVQIKRLEPHPPHDDNSGVAPAASAGTDVLPHTLISAPAQCPYCAIPNFGVTYDAPIDVCTGVGGTKPSKYEPPKSLHESDSDDAICSSPNSSPNPPSSPRKQALLVPKTKPRRKSSLAVNGPGVISIDMIRPDWETTLNSARSKLARKAATASAIHASNLILNADDEVASSNGSPGGSRREDDTQLSTIEQRMIEEALRLSILDEEERRAKETKK